MGTMKEIVYIGFVGLMLLTSACQSKKRQSATSVSEQDAVAMFVERFNRSMRKGFK